MNPSDYRPQRMDDLVGPAHRVGRILDNKVSTLNGKPLKVLLFGSPGNGKTAIAKLLTARLVTTPTECEEYNGKMVGIDTVKGWIDRLGYDSLFGGYQVIHVDEVDQMSRDAQNLCLTFLDKLTGRRAFIATSNLQLDLLQERFHTRLQQFKVLNPTTEEIVDWLCKTWKVPPAVAVQCAILGNVRSALLDLQNWFDAQAIR